MKADFKGLRKGSVVWFKEESKPYTVRALNDRYVVLTKPFNLKKTVFYTIIDLNNKIRSSDDRLFCSGYETDEQCNDRLSEITRGDIKLSRRNQIPCNVIRVKH